MQPHFRLGCARYLAISPSKILTGKQNDCVEVKKWVTSQLLQGLT